MKVSIPADVSSWQGTLTDWQREHLVGAARGGYRSDGAHGRIVIVRTDYGFDILGVKRVSCFTSEGEEIEDAWALDWVEEVHPACVNHGDSQRKYGRPTARRRHRDYDGMGEGHWGMVLRRRVRRRRRREAKRHVRQQAWMRGELDRLMKEQAEWVGHPTTFPHYDQIHELQSALDDEEVTEHEGMATT